MVSNTPRPHFTPGKDLVPFLQETGWAQGPVWTGEKSRPYQDSIPDRPAHSRYTDRATRPITEINTRNISWGQRQAVHRVENLHVPIVLKSGSLNLLKPSGPVHACNGIALPFTVIQWNQFFYVLYETS